MHRISRLVLLTIWSYVVLNKHIILFTNKVEMFGLNIMEHERHYLVPNRVIRKRNS